MVRLRLKLVLASASPRRRELLAQIVSSFEVAAPTVDEDAVQLPDPWQRASELARLKAAAGSQAHPHAITLGADTIVALESEGEWEFLAKPDDAEDAQRMLRRLSGRRHAVITGVALVWPTGNCSFCETSWVEFRELSSAEIRDYVATGEPMDKAGAYAIQGGAKPFITRVEGSLSTVIGLPLERLGQELVQAGLAEFEQSPALGTQSPLGDV